MQKNIEDLKKKKSNIKSNSVEEGKKTKVAVNKTAKTTAKKITKAVAEEGTKVAPKKATKSVSKKVTSKKAEAVVAPKETAKTAVKKATKTTTKRAAKSTDKKVKAIKDEAVVVPKEATKTAVKKSTKTTTKKAAAKKTKKSSTPLTSRKKSAKKSSKKLETLEYYDLPYRYNQTVVRILAQTPTTLFVYWDISDSDRESYVKEFGENFFNDTYPVLIVHNKTMNYSFEIEINDFANSWYFTVNDAKCDYEIELGRRARHNIHLPNNYVYVTSSNVIEAPNNHILFEKKQSVIFFKNVKTGNKFGKDISNFNFMQYMGRIYNIYDIYKKIYKAEELNDIEQNPSSSFNKGF